MSTLHITDLAIKIDTDAAQRWELTISNGRVVVCDAELLDGAWTIISLRDLEDDLPIVEPVQVCVPVPQAAFRLTNNWLRQFTA